ncbi:OTU-like cysteine protease family protein expressed [Zostera marina]|uniref:Ubiquitin thioesterase OTU n=1 Tax=Zostera marina TaxID=29655 RepID=A0A0K9PQI8_ZOSMR|nr:OTU-like cysteine protease family protein expressed [Zostera marina]
MGLAGSPSNDVILGRLMNGIESFEIIVNGDSSNHNVSYSNALFTHNCIPTGRPFARIGRPLGEAVRKVEHYNVRKITGDGRCMFRALAKGMAANKGITLNMRQETNDADELRIAVKEVICNSEEERHKYEEAIIAITVDESLKQYCQRIQRCNFWGGESELLVLSRLCRQSIIVYIPEHEYTRGHRGGVIPIAEYGVEFIKGGKNVKPRKPVRLLYSGKNHYDLLL